MADAKVIRATHTLFIVKRNDGKTIRLARFTDILYNEKPDKRLEIEIEINEEEAKNINWQTNCIIWWALGHREKFWYEGTRDDEKAEGEYQYVVNNIKNFPDADAGTLIRRLLKDKFTVVDGSARKLN